MSTTEKYCLGIKQLGKTVTIAGVEFTQCNDLSVVADVILSVSDGIREALGIEINRIRLETELTSCQGTDGTSVFVFRACTSNMVFEDGHKKTFTFFDDEYDPVCDLGINDDLTLLLESYATVQFHQRLGFSSAYDGPDKNYVLDDYTEDTIYAYTMNTFIAKNKDALLSGDINSRNIKVAIVYSV